MADIGKAFSVDDGIAFGLEDVGIVYGTDVPSTSGQTAPIGSLYLRAGTPETYIKAGAGDFDWRLISLTPRKIMSYTALRL